MAMNPPSIQNGSTQSRSFGNPVVQAIMLLLILVLFSWFLLRPKLSQSMESRTNLVGVQSQLAQIQQENKDLESLVEQLHSSPDEIAKVDEALPLNGRVSKAYVLLENLVQTSGMGLTLLNADDTASIISAGDKELLKDPYQEGRELHTVTLSTSITGTMDQFKNFLQLVETSSRVLDVSAVEINGGEDPTKFRVTIKAYSYEILSGGTKTDAN